jgi:hypothetical protein
MVEDANGQVLGFFYFEDEDSRRAVMKRLTRDEKDGNEFRAASDLIEAERYRKAKGE